MKCDCCCVYVFCACVCVCFRYWGPMLTTKNCDNNQRPYTAMMEPVFDNDIPFVIKTGGPDAIFELYFDPASLEYFFQTFPNFYGLIVGEMTWSYFDAEDDESVKEKNLLWLTRIIQVANKHGGRIIMGEGAYAFAWDRFLGSGSDKHVYFDRSFVLENKDTIVPCPKTNIFWAYHLSEASVLGGWLAGLTSNMGIWAEAWYTDVPFIK